MYSGMLMIVLKLGMLGGFPVALGCCGKSLRLPCLSTAGLHAHLIAFSLTSAVWGDGLQLWHALPLSGSCQIQLHCRSLYQLKINFTSRLAFQSFSSSANPACAIRSHHFLPKYLISVEVFITQFVHVWSCGSRLISLIVKNVAQAFPMNYKAYSGARQL